MSRSDLQYAAVTFVVAVLVVFTFRFAGVKNVCSATSSPTTFGVPLGVAVGVGIVQSVDGASE